MTKLQQNIQFLNFFSLGLMSPILTLILLNKGATLQTLPLILAVYSFTAMVIELPSGILADMIGRKEIFLVASLFQAVSCILLCLAMNTIGLFLFAVFSGVSRAFSSGSLDALFIDDAIARDKELHHVISRMSILEGAGLALGSICGGMLASLTDNYMSSVYLRFLLVLIVAILCIAFVKEIKIKKEHEKKNLLSHLKEGKHVIFKSDRLMFLFLGVFFVGIFLSFIETYWQPAFLELNTMSDSSWILGFIVSLSFACTVIGNIIANYIMKKSSDRWKIFIFLRFIMSMTIVIFALQVSAIGFVGLYALVYLLFATGNVVESVIINTSIPSSMRASIISLISLILQIGSLCASIFSSIMIYKLGITGLWILSGCMMGLYAIMIRKR